MVSPGPAQQWHPLVARYLTVDLDDPASMPKADIVIGTSWTTIRAAVATGAPTIFHFCQGFEGVHREYAPILPKIDEAYAVPIPKLLISAHLEPVLRERYGSRCYLIGQSIDTTIFTPGPFREDARPLRVGVVGPYGIRPKGIDELLRGLRLTREAGHEIEVHHASPASLDEGEAALGVTDRYYERLSTAEMAEFYRGLDVYIHPSWDEEGFPLPPLEAMASGVAVALTDIRSFRPIPEDAALRFRWGSPEAIPPLFSRFADPATRRRLREAGLRLIADYRHDAVMDKVEEAFAAEGAGRRRGPG